DDGSTTTFTRALRACTRSSLRHRGALIDVRETGAALSSGTGMARRQTDSRTAAWAMAVDDRRCHPARCCGRPSVRAVHEPHALVEARDPHLGDDDRLLPAEVRTDAMSSAPLQLPCRSG